MALTIREMTAQEVWARFGDLSHRGVLVEDACRNVLACVGYKQLEKTLYGHSLRGDGGIGTAMLVQYLRKLRDELGLDGVHFDFDLMNPCWQRMIESGKVKLTGFNAVME